MSSYGICCFRKEHSKELEVLVLRRRYTYNYCLFMYNNYSSIEELEKIISGTTLDEKLTMITLDYSRIWQKIFIDSKSDKYPHHKSLFEKIVSSIGKDTLLSIIRKSTSVELTWELPKGRKDKYPESELECACREICEETGIKRSDFRVIPDIYDNCHYRDNGSMYSSKFWVAVIKNNDWIPKCTLNDLTYHEHDIIKFVPISVSNDLLVTPMAKVIKRLATKYRSIM